jgi:hypothetical protein
MFHFGHGLKNYLFWSDMTFVVTRYLSAGILKSIWFFILYLPCFTAFGLAKPTEALVRIRTGVYSHF